MQTEKHYIYKGRNYKIGVHGLVFVQTLETDWIRTTVTRADLENIEKLRERNTARALKNARDFKLAAN